MSVRLNKLLAQRGLGARRKCDEIIQSGAVRVNGAVVLEPGLAVEPERDRVEVRGRPLPGRVSPAYYVLHKPVGVISTLSDPEGRRTLREFLPPGGRVFPVGRLDADTSGLLILTSDGELAHHLMHPRYGVPKLYRVHVDRAPSAEMLRRLREGIEFEPGVRSAPARVRARDASSGESVIELELHEGRYRQVRRMCEAAGLRVLRLHRWGYGPLRLAGLERGMWRELSEAEVRRLRSASARARPRPGGAVGGGRARFAPGGRAQGARRGEGRPTEPRGEWQPWAGGVRDPRASGRPRGGEAEGARGATPRSGERARGPRGGGEPWGEGSGGPRGATPRSGERARGPRGGGKPWGGGTGGPRGAAPRSGERARGPHGGGKPWGEGAGGPRGATPRSGERARGPRGGGKPFGERARGPRQPRQQWGGGARDSRGARTHSAPGVRRQRRPRQTGGAAGASRARGPKRRRG